MNRAFIKDPDDAGRPEDVPERPQSPHPNYVTPTGHRQLQALVAGLAAQRDRLVEQGKLANPQELALVQRDLRHYETRLARAIPVDPRGRPGDRVHFGAVVEVCDETGQAGTYQIVGEDEADPAHGKISWVSPLAEALLNAEPGEEVVWRRPAGTTRLEILAIRPGPAE
ncbi:transcription elongation factor [Geothrix rubra]|uniref:Transcription elongation factor n=1 Tax=Geothrix rubra TaxID=2927977 RepID=A0ABQ5QA10_9BACT|nr:GreA/GreB family elongation factor [Geothrix rubra]GLH71265.1 transcription elongation factor [Geothrix rubra]